MKRVFYIILAIMALPIITNLLTGGFKSKPQESSPAATAQQIAASKEREEGYEAVEHAKNFIIKSLKAPSTAKFPNYNEIQYAKKNGIWIVSTYVDAQNSFGAMVRTSYLLEIENQGDVWRLMSIATDNDKLDLQPKEQTPVAKAPQSEQQIYKSVDKNGNLVFSDNPQ